MLTLRQTNAFNNNFCKPSQARECGELSTIYARWVGGDIPNVSQDTLVLKIGHVILALLLMVFAFGIAFIILGVEILWLKLRRRMYLYSLRALHKLF